MKECWINVYQDELGIWYGAPVEVRVSPYGNTLIYRIHVRMK